MLTDVPGMLTRAGLYPHSQPTAAVIHDKSVSHQNRKNLLGNLCDDNNNNNITIASHHTIGLYNKLKGWKKIGKVIDGHCFLLFLFSSSNI